MVRIGSHAIHIVQKVQSMCRCEFCVAIRSLLWQELLLHVSMCLGVCSNPKAPFVTPHCDAEQNTVRLLSLSTQLLGALSVGLCLL